MLTLPNKVLASDTPSCIGKLDRNVSRVSTYIGSGATSFQTLILRAADNWTNPGWASDVGFAYAPNNQGTMLDIYVQAQGPSYGGVLTIDAITNVYDRNDNLIGWPPSVNYRYAVITGYANSLNVMSYDRRTAVFAHEMGHAFGLEHNESTTNSIMWSSSNNRSLYVQRVDTNTINRNY